MTSRSALQMVAAAAAARRYADDAYRAAVRAAVAEGETFAAVAEAAGVTRQAVHELAGPRPRQGPRRPPAAEKSAPKKRRSRRVAEPEPERTQGADVAETTEPEPSVLREIFGGPQ
jgi:DNA-binding protein H-NS